MMVFDGIEDIVSDWLYFNRSAFSSIFPILINRDLNGRVRLIVEERLEHDDAAQALLSGLSSDLRNLLNPHIPVSGPFILYEPDLDAIAASGLTRVLPGLPGCRIVDRLATGTRWGTVEPASCGTAQRVVFFSIKGGVGRSTALAAAARHLAEAGRRVLVIDLDLESPGLSSALLPDDRRPTYGITDWMVEDLVDNGDLLLTDMVARSNLSDQGDIRVVPAHGSEPGDYVLKLGRVWMPKSLANREMESWPQRLRRLLDTLETRLNPDIVLIDSRSGIDETASAVVTDLGARLVCLFAIHGTQTWTGYKILFQHWQRSGVAPQIRERLQIVAGMVPETGRADYLDALRQEAWNLFTAGLYDEALPGEEPDFSFDLDDQQAPHAPWAIDWHRGFAALERLHGGELIVDDDRLRAVFGELLHGLDAQITPED
ncbi:hypothetical protein GCM10011505_39600 [Tistrella bauzanensis]|uniref:CobQ/CobB/MinD/ParA nucleotide binding domain-containing protein n=1 Tax=Tistrella bauzanensis TaxID=657419 RepID=A0ABQ1J132_9PROT|nr:AAA family ATPase [Tistrella bauzanensis]GGB54699.1 hypothetical protein GCM10011505_39600 [Tistrella bauzanensis]